MLLGNIPISAILCILMVNDWECCCCNYQRRPFLKSRAESRAILRKAAVHTIVSEGLQMLGQKAASTEPAIEELVDRPPLVTSSLRAPLRTDI